AGDLERGLITSGPIGAPASGAPGAGPAVSPLVDVAEAALKNADYRGAQTIARRALDTDPRSTDAHRIIADAALALGQDGDAEREYTAALGLDSPNSRGELGPGGWAERKKKWNTAASHYSRALELSGKNVPAALGL